MPLSRRSGQRFQGAIWPGFVDAMTGLLMVLMFVLTIFTVVQFALRDVITGQEKELDGLSLEMGALADMLGLEQDRNADLTLRVAQLADDLAGSQADVEASQQALSAANSTIADFETQFAALMLEQSQARAALDRLASEKSNLAGQLADAQASAEAQAAAAAEKQQAALDQQAAAAAEQDALTTALLVTRQELDAQTQAARLAAAQAEAFEALIADLKSQAASRDAKLDTQQAELAQQAQVLAEQQQALASQATEIQASATVISELEAAQVVEAAAAQALQARLAAAQSELSILGLALEHERKEAEDTLTLLAAARASSEALSEDMRVAEDQSTALLEQARQQLSEQEELSLEARRQVEALNLQAVELRRQIGTLQDLLGVAEQNERLAQGEISSLGEQLNSALAQVAVEERKRAALEEAERQRIQAERDRLAIEAANLEQYKSDFFGEIKKIVANLDGVEVEGDRFVFSSEILFGSGDAVLSADGQAQIANVARTLKDIADRIPPEIDWIIRVDGHTDDEPLLGVGEYADNWELSQARALSVVRFMAGDLDIPPARLSANGFGEFRPLIQGSTPEARAANRRIELKLTER